MKSELALPARRDRAICRRQTWPRCARSYGSAAYTQERSTPATAASTKPRRSGSARRRWIPKAPNRGSSWKSSTARGEGGREGSMRLSVSSE